MTQQNFYENQIFEQEYPQEAAKFCNNSQMTENRFHIAEIDPITRDEQDEEGNTTAKTIRRFQIVRNAEPTTNELNERRISELEYYLNSTDWYAVRYAETGIEIPNDIKTARQAARDEISALREQIIP
ncbi:MAG: hypothetical protein PHF29_09515 [Candidatus Riflebacteria bacterium]|nr:hypothetical protein [Candidatus Riflebacteria bacterium]